MDGIVSEIGKKNNCTFCGVFRRQALDRGAASLNVDHIVTGHNADDIAETVLMNSMYYLTGNDNNSRHATVMRGDIARLGRCTLICTKGEDSIKRSKPFKYAYEKEIVMFVVYYSSNVRAPDFYQVCIFQETRLLFNRMYLLPGCVSRTCQNVPQGLGSCSSQRNHRYHPFWRSV